MPSSNPFRRFQPRTPPGPRPIRHRPLSATQPTTPGQPRSQFRGRFELVAFCLALLIFMIAIGRPEWFELRPASGSSLAMYHAAQTTPQSNSGH